MNTRHIVHLVSQRALFCALVALAISFPILHTAAATAEFREVNLATGKLFIPADWQPRAGRADLLVFFHGHPPVVCSNLTRSGKSAALVVVNFNGLSAAYSRPFADANLFGSIISNACAALPSAGSEPLAPGRLAVASFSAGFGAVREILKSPAWRERITDVVLADSLYAGYTGEPGRKVVNPAHLEDFIRFGGRAARGTATLIVTHSEQVPEGYASTTETADELIRALGAKRLGAEPAPSSGMTLLTRAAAGKFEALGFRGQTAQDHMDHLRNVAEALRRTSLAARNPGP